MLGLYDVTRTSRVRSLTARELPLAVEGYLVYCTLVVKRNPNTLQKYLGDSGEGSSGVGESKGGGISEPRW